MITLRRSGRSVILPIAAAFAMLFLFGPPVFAQQSVTVVRIAVISGGSEAANKPQMDSFREGMRALGYVEGQRYVLDQSYAEGKFERLKLLAQDLIQRKPDLILAQTTPGALAAKAATSTIPIVFVGVADPVGAGIVPALARPGGNITGITNILAELVGKRMELLRELVPKGTRMAVLVNPDDQNAPLQMRNAEAAAHQLKVVLGPVLPVRNAEDLPKAFQAAVAAKATGAVRMVDPTRAMLQNQTVSLAAKYRLPVIYPFREDVMAGGLISYGANQLDQYRQTATLVDKILRGAKASDLPVEQPTRFDLVVNMKALKSLGLTLPGSMRISAEIIE